MAPKPSTELDRALVQNFRLDVAVKNDGVARPYTYRCTQMACRSRAPNLGYYFDLKSIRRHVCSQAQGCPLRPVYVRLASGQVRTAPSEKTVC